MTAKTISRTRTGLSGIAAILTAFSMFVIVSTAVASESIHTKPEKIPTATKFAVAGGSLLTSAGLLVLRNTKYNTK